jgi:hypothetical protein
VRHNFALVHATMATLGGVPTMLAPTDFADGGLDERCVVVNGACGS